jgi:broad specificity phosphatase PhoE
MTMQELDVQIPRDVNLVARFFERVRTLGSAGGRRRLTVWVLVFGLTATGTRLGAEEDGFVRLMNTGEYVLLVRHADAPGTGDPPGFRLGDCSTQRNLSDEGRAQARSMGDWLRGKGLDRARLYSSEWCRCRETAELMGLGPVEGLPALNSFYQRLEDREPNLAALREFLGVQSRQEKRLILVTHQVTISALTGEYVGSGQGVLAKLNASGELTPVRAVNFGQ